MTESVLDPSLNGTLLHCGKVRDVYELSDGNLAMVASDRVSAFDVVMAEAVPDKGRVLTLLSQYWFEKMQDIAPNHLVRVLDDGRTTIARRADMLPVECIVRRYITGSAWKEYQASGTVHGHALPAGLMHAAKFDQPLFCASTKAAVGIHDENMASDALGQLVGNNAAKQLKAVCVAIFERASVHAAECGILLADTKFELGYIDGQLAVCDEMLTPDSSRFWEASDWKPGTVPPSFDKQPLRDWLELTGWNKLAPPPSLPAGVIDATRRRYLQAYERLVGTPLPAAPA